MQPPRLIHWSLLSFLSIAWGFAFFLIAVGLETIPPLTLVGVRLAVGALTLYLVMHWQGLKLPPPGAWWGRFTLLALVGNIIPFTLISLAETRISSAQAGLLMALMPISTMLLSHYFVAGDPLTRRKLLGVVLGFGGVAVLVGGDALAGSHEEALLAQVAVLVATVAYAINTVYTKRLPTTDTLVMASGALIVASVILLPVALVIEQPQLDGASARSLLATAALGIISTALATWAYFRVVTDCGPSFLAIINYIIPVLAFAAGVAFLGEDARPSQFIGMIVVLLGIAMTQQRLDMVNTVKR